ncbi:MAG: hypothetical protein JNJ47_00635 [Alphaproteobacteria bacterium]|nr:hypothetical protein [Alphaproteobacteria bacterium]
MKLGQKLFALFSVLYSAPALSEELPIPSNTQVSYSTSQLSAYSGVVMGNASILEISYAAPGSYAGSINMGANQFWRLCMTLM